MPKVIIRCQIEHGATVYRSVEVKSGISRCLRWITTPMLRALSVTPLSLVSRGVRRSSRTRTDGKVWIQSSLLLFPRRWQELLRTSMMKGWLRQVGDEVFQLHQVGGEVFFFFNFASVKSPSESNTVSTWGLPRTLAVGRHLTFFANA